MNKNTFVLLPAALLFWSGFSSATLITDDVNLSISTPTDVIFNDIVTISATEEEFSRTFFPTAGGVPGFQSPSLVLDILPDDSISVTYDIGSAATLGGVVSVPDYTISITDLDWIDSPGFLTDVQRLSGRSTFLDTVTFGSDFITLSSSAQVSFFANALDPIVSATFSFTAEHGTNENPQAVPEPSTLALLSIGLVGIGFARLRRKT